MPVAVQSDQEGPGYGATVLASVGAGEYPDVASAVATMVAVPGQFEPPDAELVAEYAPRYDRFTRLYPALRGAMQDD